MIVHKISMIVTLNIFVILFIFPLPSAFSKAQILVLTAASAGPAMTEIASVYSQSTGIDVRIATSSSGTLARQIQKGAPADIYLSAAKDWVNQLVNEGYLDSHFTRPLLRNHLVVISSITETNQSHLDLSAPIDLQERLGSGRLAIGDPNHVPAGQYAKQSIEALGLWPVVRERLATQTNVRAVLALVERGEAPLGIVYATDVALSKHVNIAALLPTDSHQPITYSLSILSNRTRPEVINFFKTLSGENAAKTFVRFGFGLIEKGSEDQLSKILPSSQ